MGSLSFSVFVFSSLVGGVAAIEAVKEEEKKCRSLAEKARPVLEDFMMPVKSKLDGSREVESEKDNRDKMNWMSSVQLWSDTNGNSNKNKPVGDLKEVVESEILERRVDFSFLFFWALSDSNSAICLSAETRGTETIGLGKLVSSLQKQEQWRGVYSI